MPPPTEPVIDAVGCHGALFGGLPHGDGACIREDVLTMDGHGRPFGTELALKWQPRMCV